jgi:hypothetical protein
MITHCLQAGEDSITIAKRLTLRIYRSAQGDMDGFHRRQAVPPSLFS